MFNQLRIQLINSNGNNIVDNQARVDVKNFEEVLEPEMKRYVPEIVTKLSKPLKRVGVLISGSGTNLQSLIDATRDPTQQIDRRRNSSSDIEQTKRSGTQAS